MSFRNVGFLRSIKPLLKALFAAIVFLLHILTFAVIYYTYFPTEFRSPGIKDSPQYEKTVARLQKYFEKSFLEQVDFEWMLKRNEIFRNEFHIGGMYEPLTEYMIFKQRTFGEFYTFVNRPNSTADHEIEFVDRFSVEKINGYRENFDENAWLIFESELEWYTRVIDEERRYIRIPLTYKCKRYGGMRMDCFVYPIERFLFYERTHDSDESKNEELSKIGHYLNRSEFTLFEVNFDEEHDELWNALLEPETKLFGLSFYRMLYFSAVTSTTLGYGDITPLTDRARYWVAFQSVSGLLLMGVLIWVITKPPAPPSVSKKKYRIKVRA